MQVHEAGAEPIPGALPPAPRCPPTVTPHTSPVEKKLIAFPPTPSPATQQVRAGATCLSAEGEVLSGQRVLEKPLGMNSSI